MAEIKEAELEQINPCYAMKAGFLYTDCEMRFSPEPTKKAGEDIYDFPDNCLPQRSKPPEKKSIVVDKQKATLLVAGLCTIAFILILSIATVGLISNHMLSSSQERSTLASHVEKQMELVNSTLMNYQQQLLNNVAEELSNTVKKSNHCLADDKMELTLLLNYQQQLLNNIAEELNNTMKRDELTNLNFLMNYQQQFQNAVENAAEELRNTTINLHAQTAATHEEQWKQFDNDIKKIQREQISINKQFQMFNDDLHNSLFTNMTMCGEGSWLKVAHLNMSDPLQECPRPWRPNVTHTRSCGRPITLTHPTCSSSFFPTYGFEYRQVCGRIIGYHFGNPDGFKRFRLSAAQSLNDVYVDGVSVTHGLDPRMQIWTFAAGHSSNPNYACPCHNNRSIVSVPSFVNSSRYFCETASPTNGENQSNPLWDGEGCLSNECCESPWFKAPLPNPTSDEIEVRICADQGTDDEDIQIHFLELYVQ